MDGFEIINPNEGEIRPRARSSSMDLMDHLECVLCLKVSPSLMLTIRKARGGTYDWSIRC
jgi:hypothetical protein